MTSDQLFVWIYLPGEITPSIAGKLTIAKNSSGGVLGRFVYGQNYLNNPGSISLDPVTLPLNGQVFEFTSLNGYPAVFLDGCPDKWGVRVINKISGEKDFPSGYLLMNDPGRVGAIGFSDSKDVLPTDLQSKEFSIERLLKAATDLDHDLDVAPELLRALYPGTGGARPKFNVTDSDGLWIAKLESVNDLNIVSIPRLEHAVMNLARVCGIDAAETKIIKVGNHDICLVKRFDRHFSSDGLTRSHYISARSIFYSDPQFHQVNTGSYQRLARWLPRYVDNSSQQREQLYRRMIFNVACRNSDDHELNHGLVHVANESYQLSPAFDILPVLSRQVVHQHGLLIGESGDGTIKNLISCAEAFGITEYHAKEVIADVESLIEENLLDVFYSSGFGDEGIRKVEDYFKPIPKIKPDKVRFNF